MKICQPSLVSPKVGQTQLVADCRLCLPSMNIQANIGEAGSVIIFGTSGAIVFGSTGKIKF